MAKLRKNKNLLVHIVEQHNEVVPFIHRAIASKQLPFTGIPILHFDSHPDLLIPVHLQADAVFQPQVLYEVQSIENWLLPLAFAKHLNHVIWVKPPWAHQIKPSEQSFCIGKCEQSGQLRLSCKENYFLTDGLFRPAKKLIDASEMKLTVVELLPDKWEELDSNYISPDIVNSEVADQVTETLSSQSLMTPQKWTGHLKDAIKDKAYILDIDLDFFSTANPFRNFLKADEEAALKRLYHYSPLTDFSDESIMTFTEEREKQLNQLETIFSDLELMWSRDTNDDMPTVEELSNFGSHELLGSDIEAVNCLDSQQLEDVVHLSKSLLMHRHERDVTFLQLHDFGCTIDDTELPHHISTQEQVDSLMATFKSTLEQLPKPAIITIARSSEDDYCPRTAVDQYQADVLKLLNDMYGPLQINKSYEQE